MYLLKKPLRVDLIGKKRFSFYLLLILKTKYVVFRESNSANLGILVQVFIGVAKLTQNKDAGFARILKLIGFPLGIGESKKFRGYGETSPALFLI